MFGDESWLHGFCKLLLRHHNLFANRILSIEGSTKLAFTSSLLSMRETRLQLCNGLFKEGAHATYCRIVNMYTHHSNQAIIALSQRIQAAIEFGWLAASSHTSWLKVLNQVARAHSGHKHFLLPR